MTEEPHGTTTRTSVWASATMRRHVVAMGLGFWSFWLTLGSLPAWATTTGVSAVAAGSVTTVMLTVTVLTQGTIPSLVARYGLTNVLRAGLVALAAPTPLYLVSSELWWLMCVSAVRGFGFAVLTVGGSTLTARIAPPGQRGEALGAYGLAVAVPNLVAVPLGVALTLGGDFAWVAALSAAALVGVPLMPRTDGVGATARARDRSARTRMQDVVAAAGPSLALFAVTLSAGGLVTFLPIERPDGRLAAGMLFVFGSAGALARWRTGIWEDRSGTKVLLPLAVTASSAGMVMLGAGLVLRPGPDELLLLAGAAVFGAGYGAVQNLTLVAAFTRSGNDNVASSVWNIAFDAGTATGAFATGAVAMTGLGLSGTFVVFAALIPLTAVPLWNRRSRA